VDTLRIRLNRPFSAVTLDDWSVLFERPVPKWTAGSISEKGIGRFRQVLVVLFAGFGLAGNDLRGSQMRRRFTSMVAAGLWVVC
jgi:hypothetical protein